MSKAYLLVVSITYKITSLSPRELKQLRTVLHVPVLVEDERKITLDQFNEFKLK